MFLTKYLPILIIKNNIKMIGTVQNFHLGAFLMYSIINSIVSFKNIDFILTTIVCQFACWCTPGVFNDQGSQCMLTFYAPLNHLTVRGFVFLS